MCRVIGSCFHHFHVAHAKKTEGVFFLHFDLWGVRKPLDQRLKMWVCKETRTTEDYLSAEMLSVNLLCNHSGCDWSNLTTGLSRETSFIPHFPVHGCSCHKIAKCFFWGKNKTFPTVCFLLIKVQKLFSIRLEWKVEDYHSALDGNAHLFLSSVFLHNVKLPCFCSMRHKLQ